MGLIGGTGRGALAQFSKSSMLLDFCLVWLKGEGEVKTKSVASFMNDPYKRNGPLARYERVLGLIQSINTLKFQVPSSNISSVLYQRLNTSTDCNR